MSFQKVDYWNFGKSDWKIGSRIFRKGRRKVTRKVDNKFNPTI